MVSNVEVTSIEQISYEGNQIEDENAYKVDLYITYEKELEYPSHVSLILAQVNHKLEIVKMN